MRQLMKQFDGVKKAFKNGEPDKGIDLPDPLDDLSAGNSVRDGEIKLTD